MAEIVTLQTTEAAAVLIIKAVDSLARSYADLIAAGPGTLGGPVVDESGRFYDAAAVMTDLAAVLAVAVERTPPTAFARHVTRIPGTGKAKTIIGAAVDLMAAKTPPDLRAAPASPERTAPKFRIVGG